MELEDYHRRWRQKHALRAVYQDLYRRMAQASLPGGQSLEIGGGIGNFEISSDRLLRIDIQRSSGVQVVADAHSLPFCDDVFSNVYLFDVLHHLECPLLFLSEAQRVLKTGGRVVMIEPGITPLSHLLYGMGHEEPVDMTWRPSNHCTPNPAKDPYESNQAIPTLLFNSYQDALIAAGLSLRIVENRWLSLFAYPLSGGFKAWSLIPAVWVGPLLKLEEWLLPYLGKMIAFRIMVVLEKT
jgi:SAM-dependent methyltransferase